MAQAMVAVEAIEWYKTNKLLRVPNTTTEPLLTAFIADENGTTWSRWRASSRT